MAAYHLDGENTGLYDDGLLRRFMLAVGILISLPSTCVD